MGVHTYADFSGGWYGSLDPAKVPDTMFDSRNLMVYRDGSLGPRPGLREFKVGKIIDGEIHGMDTRRDNSDPNTTVLLWLESTAGEAAPVLYRINDDNIGAGFASWDGITEPPAEGYPANLWHKSNFRTFIHIPSDDTGFYRFQQGTIFESDLAEGSKVGTSSGVRLLIDKKGTSDLYYSNPSDPLTFDPLAFITVSEDPVAEIVNISELNNYVVIVVDYGGWYMLSGVPGINDVLRQVYQDLVSPAPWGMKAFVTTAQNELYGLSPDNNYPVKFDGSQLEKLQYLSMNPEDPRASYADDMTTYNIAVVAIHSVDNDSPCFILPEPHNRMLTKANGVWTLHEFDIPTSYAWTSNGGWIYGTTQPDTLYPTFSSLRLALGEDSPGDIVGFTLTFGGDETTELPPDATGATIQAALEALDSIGPGEVSVVEDPPFLWDITLSGTLADTHERMTGSITSGIGYIDVFTFINEDFVVVTEPTGQAVVVADMILNRPAFVSDTHAQPGDLSDTPVEAYLVLPEKWTEDSDPIAVSEVVIDITHYDIGADVDPALTVHVDALARGHGVASQRQTQEWAIPFGDSTADGVEYRIRLPFGNQSAGAGYRVRIDNIVGLKFREIVVHDSEDKRSNRAY